MSNIGLCLAGGSSRLLGWWCSSAELVDSLRSVVRRLRMQRQRLLRRRAAPKATEITLTGAVQAAHVVDVPVPVDGTVEQFLAEVGQHVSEGEVLARIRNPRLAAHSNLRN